jgi:serine/threonine-protein kinase SRPK3
MSSDDSFDPKSKSNFDKGGFCLIRLGQTLNNRYKVEKCLGTGYFSMVWLCSDLNSDELVAIKVSKSNEDFHEAAICEIEFLDVINKYNDDNHIVGFKGSFEIPGHHPGTFHMCIILEVLGNELLSLLRIYTNGLPINIVKKMSKDILTGLDFLHSKCKIIMTDLKPENILLAKSNIDLLAIRDKAAKYFQKEKDTINARKELLEKEKGSKLNKNQIKKLKKKIKIMIPSPPETESDNSLSSDEDEEYVPPIPPDDDYSIKLCDMGNACWTYKHYSSDVVTRQYRPPEVIVGAEYSTSLDIFSAACVIFEMLTNEYLFDPHNVALDDIREDGISRDEIHLSLMFELLGRPPKCLYRGCSFFKEGKLKNLDYDNWSLLELLTENFNFTNQEAIEINDFLLPMLQLDQSKRISAKDALNSAWLLNV